LLYAERAVARMTQAQTRSKRRMAHAQVWPQYGKWAALIIVAALVAMARVSLSARVTRQGYHLADLEQTRLELLEENRRLKIEHGNKRSVERMKAELGASGQIFVPYDGRAVAIVHVQIRPAEPEHRDLATRIAETVAGWTQRKTQAAAEPLRLAPVDGRLAEWAEP
jgi:hypothetical protein